MALREIKVLTFDTGGILPWIGISVLLRRSTKRENAAVFRETGTILPSPEPNAKLDVSVDDLPALVRALRVKVRALRVNP